MCRRIKSSLKYILITINLQKSYTFRNSNIVGHWNCLKSQQSYYYCQTTISSSDKMMPESDGPTTNEEDQRKVQELKTRLQQQNRNNNNNNNNNNTTTTGKTNDTGKQQQLPSVEIAEGRHKYVLIKSIWTDIGDVTGTVQYIVTSRQNASYHQNAAEPMIEKMERYGTQYTNIEVTGGGRINYDITNKKIFIYGHSYGFGIADHSISQAVIQSDPRYNDYEITWSNEGY